MVAAKTTGLARNLSKSSPFPAASSAKTLQGPSNAFAKTILTKTFAAKNKPENQMSDEQRGKIVSVLTIKNFMVNASKFKRDTMELETVQSLSVDEILTKIESRLTLDLEEISREIEGDVHAHQASAARLPERVKAMTERMTKVQQSVDEVLLV
jgi:uncharacterized coiled-coil protein SlyX